MVKASWKVMFIILVYGMLMVTAEFVKIVNKGDGINKEESKNQLISTTLKLVNVEDYKDSTQFLKIDKILRRDFNLRGYIVTQIKTQVVIGTIYYLTYKNAKGDSQTYEAASDLNGGFLIQYVNGSTNKLQDQTVLTREQYESHPDFLKIDKILRRDFNLRGYIVTQIKTQVVIGTIYYLTYKNAKGDSQTYEAASDLNGGFLIQYVNGSTNKLQDQTVLTREQYESHPDFLKIDKILRRDFNLRGYIVTQIKTQVVIGTIYYLTYKNAKGDSQTYEAASDLNGGFLIQYVNGSTNKLQDQTVLTREQYESHPDFLKIDKILRRDFNLRGYIVTQIKTQVVIGTIYYLTYKNAKGDSQTYEAASDLNGGFLIQYVNGSTNKLQDQTVLTREQYESHPDFLKIDKILRRDFNLRGYIVTQIKTQVVIGTIYYLTYKNAKGDSQTYEAASDLNGGFLIQYVNGSTNKLQDQTVLTREQYESHPDFLKIDKILRRDFNLRGYIVTQIKTQVVIGTIYYLTYKNAKGDSQTYEAASDLNGGFLIQYVN